MKNSDDIRRLVYLTESAAGAKLTTINIQHNCSLGLMDRARSHTVRATEIQVDVENHHFTPD